MMPSLRSFREGRHQLCLREILSDETGRPARRSPAPTRRVASTSLTFDLPCDCSASDAHTSTRNRRRFSLYRACWQMDNQDYYSIDAILADNQVRPEA
jgi:hypothetical protein